MMIKRALSQCHKRHSEYNALKMNEEAIADSVTVGGSRHVTEKVDFHRFETLVTRIQSIDDTPLTQGGDACDVSDTKHYEPEKGSRKTKLLRILKWFDLALSEGHIEPSQPLVGRQVGWPVRPFNFSSLWVDYCLWNNKRGVEVDEFFEKGIFRCLVFLIFERHEGELIIFPSLEKSRINFKSLRCVIEYFDFS